MTRLWEKLRRVVSQLLFAVVSPEAFEDSLNRMRSHRSAAQATIPGDSSFFPEAIVENLTYDRSRLRIGHNTHIRGEVTLYAGADHISIGNACYIGRWSVLRANKRLTIGDNVLISHRVTVIDSDGHSQDSSARAKDYHDLVTLGHPDYSRIPAEEIVIEDNAWIGCDVVILKGVRIGKGAVVGAGSVVTHSIPPFALAIGNPARVIREGLR